MGSIVLFLAALWHANLSSFFANARFKNEASKGIFSSAASLVSSIGNISLKHGNGIFYSLNDHLSYPPPIGPGDEGCCKKQELHVESDWKTRPSQTFGDTSISERVAGQIRVTALAFRLSES